jgi:hypothetical protein
MLHGFFFQKNFTNVINARESEGKKHNKPKPTKTNHDNQTIILETLTLHQWHQLIKFQLQVAINMATIAIKQTHFNKLE